MTLGRLTTLAALAIWLPAALAAADAAQVVGRLREARLSPGFELRLRVVDAAAGATAGNGLKLSLVGRFEPDRRSLAIRGIAPETVNGQIMVIDHAAGCTRAADRSGSVDPFAELHGSGLAAWDLVAPWLDWQQQSLGGGDRVAGRECTVLRSRNDDGPIREVRSCVDTEAGLTLRTRLFDAQGRLLRSIQVLATTRKESGALAARRIAITRGDRHTELEAYSGDEHYEVPADAFALVAGMPCR